MPARLKTTDLDWESLLPLWDNARQQRASQQRAGRDCSQQGIHQQNVEALQKLDKSKTDCEQWETDTIESSYVAQSWPLPQPCESLLHGLSNTECEKWETDALESSNGTQSWPSQPCESPLPDEGTPEFDHWVADTIKSSYSTQLWSSPQPRESLPHSQLNITFEQWKVDSRDSTYFTQLWPLQKPCKTSLHNQSEINSKDCETDAVDSLYRTQPQPLSQLCESSSDNQPTPWRTWSQMNLDYMERELMEQQEEEKRPRLLAEEILWFLEQEGQAAKERQLRLKEQEKKLMRLQERAKLLDAIVKRINELIILRGRKRKRKRTEDFSSGEKKFYVAGSVYGTAVEALPDTGADTSFISPDLASRFGLRPIPGTWKTVTLANKKAIKSPGMVKVPWKFTKERNTHTMNCWILPGCIRDMVLGNPFLHATQTLTKFRDRIKSKFLGTSRLFSLNLLGDEKQRLRGYLNGRLATALADTGSDAMLIDGGYARNIGLTIDSNVENQVKVRLSDGSIAMTSGIVREVDWKVGGTTVQCGFYVLENMCVDVILSNNYLFEMDIFSKEKEHFFDITKDYSKEPLSYFCGLRVIKKRKKQSKYLSTKKGPELDLIDAVVSILTPQEMEEREKQEELYRRDKKRDEIMALPECQREAAARAEKARQQLWEASRLQRETKWLSESHTATASVQSSVSWRRRWRKWILIKFSTKEQTAL